MYCHYIEHLIPLNLKRQEATEDRLRCLRYCLQLCGTGQFFFRMFLDPCDQGWHQLGTQ